MNSTPACVKTAHIQNRLRDGIHELQPVGITLDVKIDPLRKWKLFAIIDGTVQGQKKKVIRELYSSNTTLE